MTRQQPANANHLTTTLLALFDGYIHGLNAAYLQVRAGRTITPQVIQQFRIDGILAVFKLVAQVQAVVACRITHATTVSAENIARMTHFENALRHISLNHLDMLVRRLIGHCQRLANALTQPAGAIGLLLQQTLEQPASITRIRPLVRDMVQEMVQALFAQDA